MVVATLEQAWLLCRLANPSDFSRRESASLCTHRTQTRHRGNLSPFASWAELPVVAGRFPGYTHQVPRPSDEIEEYGPVPGISNPLFPAQSNSPRHPQSGPPHHHWPYDIPPPPNTLGGPATPLLEPALPPISMVPCWSSASITGYAVRNQERMSLSHRRLALFPQAAFYFTDALSFRSGPHTPFCRCQEILRPQTDGSATNVETSTPHPIPPSQEGHGVHNRARGRTTFFRRIGNLVPVTRGTVRHRRHAHQA